MRRVTRVGDRRLVFDAREWGGRDVGDNEQFWHPATILEVGPERDPAGARYRDQVAHVRFEHDGRVSRGHFVSTMRPVEPS